MVTSRPNKALWRSRPVMDLKAVGLNCTLSPSPKPTSSQKMLDQLLDCLSRHGVKTSSARVVDFNIKPGVRHDEGSGDDWPALRERIMDSDILVIATPIWMGQASSVAKRVLERLDAILGDIGDDGRYPTLRMARTMSPRNCIKPSRMSGSRSPRAVPPIGLVRL